jgi:hypothetical protein
VVVDIFHALSIFLSFFSDFFFASDDRAFLRRYYPPFQMMAQACIRAATCLLTLNMRDWKRDECLGMLSHMWPIFSSSAFKLSTGPFSTV